MAESPVHVPVVRAVIFLAFLGARLLASVQDTPTPGQPAFDVASVKPNGSGERRATIDTSPGGTFTATNVPTRTLIAYAYDIQERQVAGGPAWLATDRFDVQAKVGDQPRVPPPVQATGSATIRLMVRSLLAERFSLVAHTEEREEAVYHLVLSRPDRGLGPRIRPTTADCSEARPCPISLTLGALHANGRTPAQLGNILSQFLQRPVFDRTGLSGMFEVDLTWTPDAVGNVPADAVPPVDPDRPTLFTAVQEQLGLRLQAARGPILTLVVDRVDRPSPN